MTHTKRFLQFASVAALLAAPPVRAQWQVNGVPLSTAPGTQRFNQIAPDGAGGAIATWADERSGGSFPSDIYVRRVDKWGFVLWATNGVAICTMQGDQYGPQIVSDGAGGAIVTWWDGRTGPLAGTIFAQRVNAAGTPLWALNGVVVCAAPLQKGLPVITADGAGGAIIAWSDNRGGDADIYVQRINASGTVLWSPDGVALCTAADDQVYPAITSDDAGGAIVAWEDHRLGLSNMNIFANRVDASGNLAWLPDGMGICYALGNQFGPQIAPNGASGAIIAWMDSRYGESDIFVREVLDFGGPVYPLDGLGICTAPGFQLELAMVSDNAGGAIVTWRDGRNVPSDASDIYAQRVDASTAPLWAPNGVAVCTTSGFQGDPAIASDGVNGCLVTWMDQRSGGGDIYARRIDGAGASGWPVDGVAVTSAGGEQLSPAITPDNAGGAIIAWGETDSHAQRIGPGGYWGATEPRITSVVDVPGDQGGFVTVNWREDSSVSPFYGYDVYRDDFGVWNYVGGVVEDGSTTYSLTVPTLADSACGSPFPHQFQVVGVSASLAQGSNIGLGSSVDNLAPAAPTLVGSRTMAPTQVDVTLTWNLTAVDIASWDIYLDGFYFATAYDTTYVTSFGPPFADQTFTVRAYDSHCNVGEWSGEIFMPEVNTFPGSNVNVTPRDVATGATPVTVGFTSVRKTGATSLGITQSGQPLTGGFSATDGNYYQLETTATTSGAI